MKKQSLMLLGIATIGLIIIFFNMKFKSSNMITIGILQTVSHPALDQARKGFISKTKELLKGKVNFIIQNAQGSLSQAHVIAQQFHAHDSVNGIFAIATPAVQAMAQVEKKKPIFIAAVTDPYALGIIHPKTNVCGTSDMINVDKEIEMLLQLLPHSKTVALLFNPGEINSVTLAKKMRNNFEKRNIKTIDVGIINTSEVRSSTLLACSQADVILAPTDNTVASALPTIAKIALEQKTPLIVSDNLLVAQGALAARGVDYFQSGVETALIAFQVISKGKNPAHIPLKSHKNSPIVINKNVANKLEIKIPKHLLQQAHLIGDIHD